MAVTEADYRVATRHCMMDVAPHIPSVTAAIQWVAITVLTHWVALIIQWMTVAVHKHCTTVALHWMSVALSMIAVAVQKMKEATQTMAFMTKFGTAVAVQQQYMMVVKGWVAVTLSTRPRATPTHTVTVAGCRLLVRLGSPEAVCTVSLM